MTKQIQRRLVRKWDNNDADYRYFLQYKSDSFPVGGGPDEEVQWSTVASSSEDDWAYRHFKHYELPATACINFIFDAPKKTKEL